MKFPQGEGSAVIHRKKNRPALQRHDIWTVSLGSSFCFHLIGHLLKSSPTQFLVVLFFIALYTSPFSSEHFFWGLSVRSLSTQLFCLVVLLLLPLSMTSFSYVGLLSLFWVRLFHALCLSHLPSSSFLEGLFSEQFAELGSVHLLAFSVRSCSLAFLSSGSLCLAICRAVFIAELHCPQRMHVLNSCVGDIWQRLWRDGFTHNGKQVVNRLKIPQGLSTLMFRRWSEVPSRGGVRGDSP